MSDEEKPSWKKPLIKSTRRTTDLLGLGRAVKALATLATFMLVMDCGGCINIADLVGLFR